MARFGATGRLGDSVGDQVTSVRVRVWALRWAMFWGYVRGVACRFESLCRKFVCIVETRAQTVCLCTLVWMCGKKHGA